MKSEIQATIKVAMKSKDKIRLDTARLLLSAIQYEEMQKKVDDLGSEACVALLQREINRRKEELEYAEKGARADLKEKLLTEIKVIEEFLPKQLSPDELESILLKEKEKNPAFNLGMAMKALKETYSGQYDGKLASEIAKKVLG